MVSMEILVIVYLSHKDVFHHLNGMVLNVQLSVQVVLQVASHKVIYVSHIPNVKMAIYGIPIIYDVHVHLE
jgi:hypothetical protein